MSSAVRTASLLLWSNNFAWARPFSRVGRKCLGSAAPPPFISAAFPAGRAKEPVTELLDPGSSSSAQLRTLGPRGLLALGRNFPFPLPPEVSLISRLNGKLLPAALRSGGVNRRRGSVCATCVSGGCWFPGTPRGFRGCLGDADFPRSLLGWESCLPCGNSPGVLWTDWLL